MFSPTQLIILSIVFFVTLLCFYKTSEWFSFFIVFKTLHLFITVNLLQEVVVYNSTSILVAILYILCLRVLKSVLRVLLMILNYNKNNSSFF